MYDGSVFLRAFTDFCLKKERGKKIFVIYRLEISVFKEIRKSSDV